MHDIYFFFDLAHHLPYSLTLIYMYKCHFGSFFAV